MGSSEEQAMQFAVQLGKPLKEGERILGPTRRPDGTLRKPIRIRAGYVPQDEVAIYQSRGSLWRKEMESQVVPGYDPSMDSKPKSKSVKRNEKKKEKKLQAALEMANNSEQIESEDVEKHAQAPGDVSQELESVTPQMKQLALSTSSSTGGPSSDSVECVDSTKSISDIDKKIRALKKKIRLTKAQQQKHPEQDMKPEQLEKMNKLESWQEEIKLLEGKRAEVAS